MICYEWRGHQAAQDVTIFQVARGIFPLHSHRGFHELLIVEQGQLRHRINGKSQTICEGTLLLVREADCHELLGGDCLILNLPFTVDWLERLEALFHAPGLSAALLDGDPPQVCLTQARWQVARDTLHVMLKHADDMGCRSLFASLFLGLFADYLQPQVKPETSSPAWLNRLLADASCSELSVRELAARAGCTPEHLARTFRRYLHLSPKEYLNRRRMEDATNLLRHTNLRVKEIALRSGFASESYFCKQFLKQIGMQPGAYRRNHAPEIFVPAAPARRKGRLQKQPRFSSL